MAGDYYMIKRASLYPRWIAAFLRWSWSSMILRIRMDLGVTLEKVLRKRSGKAERNGFYLNPAIG